MPAVREISSLEELERSWKRVDSLVALRDWVNGGTLLLLVILLQWDYRDLAWALWTNLIWTGSLIVVASIVMRLSGIDRSGHPVEFWIGLVAGSVGLVFGWTILGALLSFFAANEPDTLLGPNGFINADTFEILRHTSLRYAPALLLVINELFFCVRSSHETHSPASAHLGGYVGKMIGGLLVGVLVGVALVGLFSPRIAEIGVGVFYLLWFLLPWRILTKDTIQDQQSEGRPELYAGRLLPLKFSERAGPLMVIITLVLMLMFGGFGFTMIGFGARQIASHGLTLGSAINFWIGRLLGKKWIRRWIPAAQREKMDLFVARQGVVVLLIFFIFPGFPKDYLCFFLGVTRLPFNLFILLAGLGRIPGTLLLSLQGDALFDRKYGIYVATLAASMVIVGLAVYFREAIYRWAERANNGS